MAPARRGEVDRVQGARLARLERRHGRPTQLGAQQRKLAERVAWPEDGERCGFAEWSDDPGGDSFATPHLAGLCARILAKRPGLTPFQLKTVLYLTADTSGSAWRRQPTTPARLIGHPPVCRRSPGQRDDDRARVCRHQVQQPHRPLLTPRQVRRPVGMAPRQHRPQPLDDATGERDGKQRLQALVDELDRAGYTAAGKCLADDLDALVVHLHYPTRHRRRWRSTNLLERSLGEVKRRTKVIGRFPGETSCLTLVWAVLDLYITHATNGIKFTQLERQRLRRLRYEGHDATTPEEVTAA
jgi:hypothetical protein